jgi:hypothetical protein
VRDVNDPWWTYGLDFAVGVLSGAVGMRLWAWWRPRRLFKDKQDG